MTENKRYSDGSLAKWYYSRDYNGMRVISNGVDEFTLNSKKQFKDINSKELKGTNQLLDELNKLEDKIIILEKENKELKFDNDIKFWKHQFMMRYNDSQIIMHEISRAIDEGYKISEEFQKYLNESKTRDSENREKIERLGI